MRDQDNGQIARTPVSIDRRNMLLRSGADALAVEALTAGGVAGSATPANAQGVTDADILSFALNLEYLEAEYYIRAATGPGLTASDWTGTGTPGAGAGSRPVPFATSSVQQYANEITTDELKHVRFLLTVLGANAVAAPAIDIQNSFSTLAQAAELGNSFDSYADENSLLLGAYISENVGVTAYHSAAASVQNKQILTAAAGHPDRRGLPRVRGAPAATAPRIRDTGAGGVHRACIPLGRPR